MANPQLANYFISSHGVDIGMVFQLPPSPYALRKR